MRKSRYIKADQAHSTEILSIIERPVFFASLVPIPKRMNMKRLHALAARSQAEGLIARCAHFYNFVRIQLKNGLAPDENRSKAV